MLVFCLTSLITTQHQKTMAQDFAYLPPSLDQNDEDGRKELKELLTSLEKKFGVYFTFESAVVRNKFIQKDVKVTEDLEQTLMNVLNPVNLKFKKLSDKFYTIYPTKEEPKSKKRKANHGWQGMDSRRIQSLFRISTDGTLPPLQFAVSGVVTDENNLTLPGASVLEKGNTNGTATDAEGRFSLNVSDANATLVISFIGYTSQEVSINGRSVINVALTPSVQSLEEVVVVGYGIQRKRDLTGSVASVSAEELQERPNISVMQSLQGAIPGMNVGQVNTAGGEPSLSIRGRTSISGDQDPLIVLDGVIFRGSIIDINPNDIKSIDILKDASSTAVYGSRAANGVIIITTKTGKLSDKLIVNYSTFYSILEPTKKFLPESPPEQMERITAAYFLDSRTEASGYLDPKPGYDITSTFRTSDHLRAYNAGLVTDWYDLTTNSSLNVVNHNVSIVNRNDRGGYFLSAGYAEQDGYMVNEDYDRFNARINIDNKITDWLEVGVQTFLTSSDYSGFAIDPTSRYIFHWYAPAYEEDGVTLVQNPRGVGTGTYNPLLLMQSDDLDKRLNLFGNVYADVGIPFVKGLSFKINYNVNAIRNSEYFYRPYVNDFQGQGRKYEGIGNDWANDNILTYNKTLNKHRINATVAYGREKRTFNSTTATAFNFISDQLGYNRLQAGSADLQSVSSAAWQETSLYNLNRLFYGYDDRYLFTVTVRTDGFSGFGEDYKYGTFPSASAAWVLSEENFIRESLEFLDHLKLRGSYGANGNRTIGRYATRSRVEGGFNYINGEKIPVYTQGNASLANADLKWEATIGMNIGLDFSIFKTRLSGSIDYYNTNTEDLLYDVDIPGITRFESISDNLGELHNEGLEVTLSSRNILKEDFQWSTDVNFSRNRNELRELLGFDSDGNGVEDDLISEGLFIGESLGAIYDYDVSGEIWQIGEEIPTTADLGSYKITDTDGNGVIDPDDRVILGNSSPAFRFSMNNRFKYKNWSLSIFINSIQGNDHYYLGRDAIIGSAFNNLNNTLFDVTSLPEGLDFWLPENPDARYQRLGVRLSSGINGARYIERSFVRLQDVSLSYTLNQETLDRVLKINGLRLFLTGKNLYTWTTWPGWDAETGQRITASGRPVMRHYTFGIDVKF
jgi:TonB-linked SusC/RagA family outer membrane protein